MATRQVLADLVASYERRSGVAVAIESVGGVDAARRIRAGEAFDLVVLACEAIDTLLASGLLLAGTRIDLVRSGVAVAVRHGAARPPMGTEDELRRAVRSARSLSCSTGPSGVALARLFERWEIADEIRPRIVQAPPGVPVGMLVARGEAELGFQQLSELMHVEGIDVIGPLPPAIQIVTIFSAAVGARSTQAGAVRGLLDFMTSPQSADTMRRHGMEPA